MGENSFISFVDVSVFYFYFYFVDFSVCFKFISVLLLLSISDVKSGAVCFSFKIYIILIIAFKSERGR